MKHHIEKVFAVAIFVFFVGCSGEYQDVKIIIEDFRFTPSQIYLHAKQPIRLVVRNQGRELHRFKSKIFSDPRINLKWNSAKVPSEEGKGMSIAPGQSIEIILSLSPGIYDFRCPIRGHRGMDGMLIVDGAGREFPLAHDFSATCQECDQLQES